MFKYTRVYHRFKNNILNIPKLETLLISYGMRVPYFNLDDKAFALTSYCIRQFVGMHEEGTVGMKKGQTPFSRSNGRWKYVCLF